MRLFLNERPLRIFKPQEWVHSHQYDLTLDGKADFENVKLAGRVLVVSEDERDIIPLIYLYLNNPKKLKKLTALHWVTDNYKGTREITKQQFKIVKAAGGLVTKDNLALLIFRLGKWDLPKGKLEKGEETEVGAVREVEEECNIKAALGPKIVSTWHCYLNSDVQELPILKKTTWYHMTCVDDSQMAPQTEEGIEDIQWMTQREVEIAMKNTYGSIKEVFEQFATHSPVH